MAPAQEGGPVLRQPVTDFTTTAFNLQTPRAFSFRRSKFTLILKKAAGLQNTTVWVEKPGISLHKA